MIKDKNKDGIPDSIEESIDKKTQSKLNHQLNVDWNEEINLLYVALTRSRQYLYISGVQIKRDKHKCWYSIIEQSLADYRQDTMTGTWVFKHGTPPQLKTDSSIKKSKELKSTINLSKPFENIEIRGLNKHEAEIITQQSRRGTLIHKLFELVAHEKTLEPALLCNRLESAFDKEIGMEEFTAAMQEVKQCLNTPELDEIFTSTPEKEILSETPICFIENGEVLYRVIDRLIITDELAWIIDFKTVTAVKKESMHLQAMQYRSQISSYYSAVRKMYPNKKTRASILFTAIPALYDFDESKLLYTLVAEEII